MRGRRARPLEIAIVGSRTDERTAALTHEVTRRFLPNAVYLRADPGVEIATPLLAERPLVDGAPSAYVCEGYACKQPVTTPDALTALLDEALAARQQAS